MSIYKNDYQWSQIVETLNKTVSRRDFIITSVAAGVMTMVPRFATAGKAEPYKIGVCLPTTGA